MSKTKIIERSVYAGGLRLRESGEGEPASRVIEGYAVRFGSASVAMGTENGKEVREYIAPEALTREVLEASDIRMTMFHDSRIILARSKQGKGTLSWDVDEKGVSFSFEAPRIMDGDKALELVARGDVDGCSFAFLLDLGDPEAVSREETDTEVSYTIRKVVDVRDFTLTDSPAYPETECAAYRDLAKGDDRARVAAQIAAMRAAARW